MDKLGTKDLNKDIEVKVKGSLFYLFIKRTFDVFSSFFVLVLIGWLIFLLMFIKWLEDLGKKSYKLEITEDINGKYLSTNGKRYNCVVKKDPKGEIDTTVHGPIYTSLRVGKNGKIFKFHKIRSMCPGAEKMKETLLKYGLNEEDGPAFKIKDDPRITKFGRFLRKTSLDELPQIWDIFVGRMSVVGPRPPIPEEVKQYDAYQMHRLDVKGGLLCLWQIQPNKNDLTFDEWIKLDIEYIQKRSVLLDMKIIFKGAFYLISGGGEEYVDYLSPIRISFPLLYVRNV